MSILKMLSGTLLMKKGEIVNYALTSPHRYKVYTIPKRGSNKRRVIAHPAKELKFIQRLVVSYLEKEFPVHKCAFAYRSGVSVRDNAAMHVNSKYLLKMDFKDYFHSVTPELFFDSLNKSGFMFDEIDLLLLKNFLFYKPDRRGGLKLSIGAPSSPLVSNFVLYWFDSEMHEMCENVGVNYTRYADDITFSTNKRGVLFEIHKCVGEVLDRATQGNVKVNHEKTVFSSKAHNRHVTGVTLTNDNKLSVGRDRKRKLSAMMHKFSHDLLDEEEILHLRGMLAYVSHIEPLFLDRMESKYGKDTLDRLRRYKSNK